MTVDNSNSDHVVFSLSSKLTNVSQLSPILGPKTYFLRHSYCQHLVQNLLLCQSYCQSQRQPLVKRLTNASQQQPTLGPKTFFLSSTLCLNTCLCLIAIVNCVQNLFLSQLSSTLSLKTYICVAAIVNPLVRKLTFT